MFGNLSDDTKIPMKHNIHEWFYGFPNKKECLFLMLNHYLNMKGTVKIVYEYFKESLILKQNLRDRFINNLLIETGFLWRICKDNRNKFYAQTLVSVFNIGSRDNLWMINYSHDWNINKNIDNLNFVILELLTNLVLVFI